MKEIAIVEGQSELRNCFLYILQLLISNQTALISEKETNFLFTLVFLCVHI
jgi:hypothetical protein